MTAAQTSSPRSPGRLRSSTRTAGRVARVRRTALGPSSAVATTLNPASVRSRATASRHIGWSSATTTVTARRPGGAAGGLVRRRPAPSRAPRAPAPPSSPASPPREHQLHRRARAHARVVDRPSPQVADPPVDAVGHAHPACCRGLGEPSRRDPDAVVAHGDHHVLVVVLDQHPGAAPSPACRRTLSSTSRTAAASSSATRCSSITGSAGATTCTSPSA